MTIPTGWGIRLGKGGKIGSRRPIAKPFARRETLRHLSVIVQRGAVVEISRPAANHKPVAGQWLPGKTSARSKVFTGWAVLRGNRPYCSEKDHPRRCRIKGRIVVGRHDKPGERPGSRRRSWERNCVNQARPDIRLLAAGIVDKPVVLPAKSEVQRQIRLRTL